MILKEVLQELFKLRDEYKDAKEGFELGVWAGITYAIDVVVRMIKENEE